MNILTEAHSGNIFLFMQTLQWNFVRQIIFFKTHRFMVRQNVFVIIKFSPIL